MTLLRLVCYIIPLIKPINELGDPSSDFLSSTYILLPEYDCIRTDIYTGPLFSELPTNCRSRRTSISTPSIPLVNTRFRHRDPSDDLTLHFSTHSHYLRYREINVSRSFRI